MKDPKWYHLEGKVKVITDKAVMIDVGSDEVWLPLSQIGDILPSDGLGDIKSGELQKDMRIDSIEIASWLGREKGLEECDG